MSFSVALLQARKGMVKRVWTWSYGPIYLSIFVACQRCTSNDHLHDHISIKRYTVLIEFEVLRDQHTRRFPVVCGLIFSLLPPDSAPPLNWNTTVSHLHKSVIWLLFGCQTNAFVCVFILVVMFLLQFKILLTFLESVVARFQRFVQCILAEQRLCCFIYRFGLYVRHPPLFHQTGN